MVLLLKLCMMEVSNIYLEIEGQDDAFPSISAELGRIYKFSIYYQNDSLSLLIDDQQVGSITIPNLSPNMIGIGAFNDEGQSFDRHLSSCNHKLR